MCASSILRLIRAQSLGLERLSFVRVFSSGRLTGQDQKNICAEGVSQLRRRRFPVATMPPYAAAQTSMEMVVHDVHLSRAAISTLAEKCCLRLSTRRHHTELRPELMGPLSRQNRGQKCPRRHPMRDGCQTGHIRARALIQTAQTTPNVRDGCQMGHLGDITAAKVSQTAPISRDGDLRPFGTQRSRWVPSASI